MIYPWQQAQWQQVLQQYQQQRLPQALLLNGAVGLGKFSFAQALAKRVLCETLGDQACNQCRQCHLFESHSHPDYFCLEPQEKSRIIKVDQVRELIGKLYKTAQIANYQVAIINTIEIMNNKAANALLKTLEEPAGNVLFILVCHRLAQVPVTILSRCQALHFYLQDQSQALLWLQQQLNNPQQAKVLLRLAGGAPLAAAALAQRDILNVREQLLKKLINITQGDNPINGVDTLLKGNIHDVLMILRSIFNDVCKRQLAVFDDKLIHSDQRHTIQQLAQRYTLGHVQKELMKITEAEKMLNSGVHINPQLLFESLLLSCV